MSTQKFKREWIKIFNEELEKINSKGVRREYQQYIANVQNEIIKQIKKKGVLSRKEIREILNDFKINLDVYNKPINAYFVGSAVAMLVNNDRLSAKMRNEVEATRFLITRSPTQTAKNVSQTTGFITTRQGVLPTKLLKGVDGLENYIVNRNAKTVSRITQTFKSDIRGLNIKIKTDLSKSIVRDLKRFKTEDGKPISFDRLAQKIENKYTEKTTIKAQVFDEKGNVVRDAKGRLVKRTVVKPKKWYIDRIINTETHAQNELVKQLDSRLKGMTRKKWIEIGDGKVRFDHRQENMEEITPIDKPFIVGGEKAQYPSDPSLSAGQRINCRCTVQYLE